MDSLDKKNNAAYALNLCTVSVSQIIDYDDLNVMEQEYDAILNNLNLENMPHDEALLNILKQILDTITFFKIEEGDKKIMDMKYRQKMRDAIWSAAPNLGLIVAGGNPVTMAISLASQIGIGYMNYRKEKAQNNLDYEEQKWRLQRTAIEQLNGLQRELLDTAWRLADAYDFEDKLRLTERQIKHYDAILMEDNPLRKYDRLESVMDNFTAYPPFWYHLGNTANTVSRDSSLGISDESREYYRNKAKEHFRQFWESNKYPLLREDQLASSCALEYADLLIEDGASKEQIVDLIDKAVQYAGNAWDVLQLCAIGYLRADAKEKAIPALKILVNERYNSSVNAQLLSGIYISEYTNNNNPEAKAMYESLKCRVTDNAYLIPWPTESTDPELEFYDNQKEMLSRRYRHMLYSFRNKYSTLLNKLIIIPEDEMQRAEADYTEDHLEERINALENTLASYREEYLADLNGCSIGINLVNLLNRMFSSLSTLPLLSNIGEPVILAEKQVEKASERIEHIQDKIKDSSFTKDDYRELQNITSWDFLEDIFNSIQKQIDDSISSMNNMLQLSSATSEMLEFCQKEDIAIPDSKEDRMKDAAAVTKKPYYLSYKLLGDKAVITSMGLAKRDEMLGIIKNKIEASIKGSGNISIAYHGSNAFDIYFSKCSTAVKDYKADVIAIMDDKTFLFDTDLLFTDNGIIIVERNGLKEICKYDSVEYNSKTEKLTIGSITYHHNGVDLSALNAALIELKQLAQKR